MAGWTGVARWAAFGAALVVQLLVLYAPDPGTGGGALPGLDKLVHVAVFAAAVWTGRAAGLPAVPLVAALAVHAGVSELVQGALLPGRDGDPLDVAADLVGVALGAVLPARGDLPGASRSPPGAS